MVPATCCFEEVIALNKKRQIQISFRMKQRLRTQGVASVVTCPCMIFTEHNTALTCHSCSGHLREHLWTQQDMGAFLQVPSHSQSHGKLLLRKDHGPEIDNMLPVWRWRTPCCVEANHSCMAWGIRS